MLAKKAYYVISFTVAHTCISYSESQLHKTFQIIRYVLKKVSLIFLQ